MTTPASISLKSEVNSALNEATLATEILHGVMKFRRFAGDYREPCLAKPCADCLAPHLPKVIASIQKNEPITFVLPAFPGKSPNLAKVLGPLPDMAERCSLEFLGTVCDRISVLYPPGARIILCSDGRVFSDAVGMRDEDVTDYQRMLSRIIHELGLDSISIFNLDEVYEELDFSEMRARLMENYGQPLSMVRDSIRQGSAEKSQPELRELHRLYCGITRFLVDDATHPEQRQTRSAIQKACRIRAYEVIQRSSAWSELIQDQFPNAVRLSIHPQGCGSKKLGIFLVDGDNWMTPWHGVAVKIDGQFKLLKRWQAEAMGAQVVIVDERVSHYEIPGAQNEL
jgi:pyoverdine/dityrosine biosynthesis protein Dit1